MLQAEDVLSAVREVLVPLVRLLLASGVDATRLAAELKPIFMEQARLELLRTGRKDTDSAISLLSGVHRKDVRKWRETGLDDKIAKEVSLSSQVYARWVQDARYRDRRRRPKPLPRAGQESSFESLARSVTLDVHPYTILAELLRLGLVHIEVRRGQEFVVPNPDGFVPPKGSKELLELFGGNVADHASSAVANLLGMSPRLEQSVFADGLSEESVGVLSDLARRLWAQARNEMIDQATRCSENDQGKKTANRRMRFGAYYWEEKMAPDLNPDGEAENQSESGQDPL